MKKFIEFKNKLDQSLLFSVHPYLLVLIADASWFCYSHNQPFTITGTISTLEKDLKLKRKSDTHRTHRAVDIRIHDWTKAFTFELVAYLESKYGKQGAVTEEGKKKLIVVKPDHLHIQLNREFSL